MADFDAYISGLEGLDAALTELGRNGARRVLAKSLRQGANVIRDDARERVRKKTKKLQRSIQTKNAGLNFGELVFTVSSSDPKAHLIENGHVLVKGGKLGEGGKVIGHVQAFPFLRPAAESSADLAVEVITETARQAMKEEVGNG